MAKKTVAAKKRVVKVDGVGQLHVHSSFNNIIVTFSGSVFLWKLRQIMVQHCKLQVKEDFDQCLAR